MSDRHQGVGDRWLLVAQLEFTHALGPSPGLYVVDHATATEREEVQDVAVRGADVLHLTFVGAPVTSGLLKRFGARRRTAADRDEVQEVPLVLATFAEARPVSSDDPVAFAHDSDAALCALRALPGRCEALVDGALAAINRAIAAHRAVTWDPYVIEVAREDARTVRVGVATADGVRLGEVEVDFVLPEPKQEKAARGDTLRPAEHVARVLNGTAELHDVEVHIVRALLDREHGRLLCARTELAAALAAGRTAAVDPTLREEAAAVFAGVAEGTPAPGELTEALDATLGLLIEAVERSRGR